MKILLTGTEGYIGARAGADPAPRTATRSPASTPASTATAACTSIPLGMPLDAAHGASRTCARVDAERFRRLRRGRAPGRAVERSARREPAGDHLQDQPRGLGAHCAKAAKRGRRAALRVRLLVQRVRPGQRASSSTRPRRPTRRPPTRKCKVKVEQDLAPMADGDFCVDVPAQRDGLRASPRMRFDIVLNDLCALAWTGRRSP